MPTKAPLNELKEMGIFPRSYDGNQKISEEIEDSDSESEEVEVHSRAETRKQVDEVLQWAKMIVPGLPDLMANDNALDDQKKLIAYFSQIRHEEEKASRTAKGRLKSILFLRFAVDAFIDLFSAARDVIEGRRRKTALAVIGCILLGTAVGILIGTLIFPGIGSAAGGALGGAVVSVLIAVGGTFGLATLGAAIGSWVGKKLGKSWFQDERRYEFRKSKANNIYNKLGLLEEDAERINAYLRNRAVSDSFHKDMCREIRIGITKNPTKKGVQIAIKFFINEIILLQDETWDKHKKKQPSDWTNEDEWKKARDNEIKAVVAILNAFTTEEVITRSSISHEAADYLKKAIADYNIDGEEHALLKEKFGFLKDRPSQPSARSARRSDPAVYESGPSHTPLRQHTAQSSSSASSSGEYKEIFKCENVTLQTLIENKKVFGSYRVTSTSTKESFSQSESDAKEKDEAKTDSMLKLTFKTQNEREVKVHIKQEGNDLVFFTKDNLTPGDLISITHNMTKALDKISSEDIHLTPLKR